MKYIFSLVFALLLFSGNSFSQATQPTFKFTVSTIKFPGSYDPRHCVAVWIEDASGKYINSLAVYGNRRLSHLTNWNNSSKGVKGNAITGATLNPHRTHVLSWNLKDSKGNVVPNGTYKLKIEGTARNSTGSLRVISFDLGNVSFTNKPADDANIKNMTIEYTVSTSTPIDEVIDNQAYFNVFPNPTGGDFSLSTQLQQPGFFSVSLVDIAGIDAKKLYSGYLSAGKSELKLHADNSVKPGTYFVVVSNNELSWSSKIVIK